MQIDTPTNTSLDPDRDPALHRVRRIAKIAANSAGLANAPGLTVAERAHILDLMADLDRLVAVLTERRDALAIEAGIVMRRVRAAATYGQVGRFAARTRVNAKTRGFAP